LPLQEQEIIRYLRLLGEELEALQVRQPLSLLVVGGAYMITQIGNRATTMDVDVVVQADPYSQEYLAFKNAVRFVASDEHIDLAWLSDNIGDFVAESKDIPARQLWLKHGMVEVYVPDPHHIFILKLVASREKDISDIQALMRHLHIKNRKHAEKLLKKYGDQNLLKEYSEEINSMLGRVFSL
jgi:hypothetical protein